MGFSVSVNSRVMYVCCLRPAGLPSFMDIHADQKRLHIVTAEVGIWQICNKAGSGSVCLKYADTRLGKNCNQNRLVLTGCKRSNKLSVGRTKRHAARVQM